MSRSVRMYIKILGIQMLKQKSLIREDGISLSGRYAKNLFFQIKKFQSKSIVLLMLEMVQKKVNAITEMRVKKK